MRYNGCNLDGIDVDGAVAKRHAMRGEDDSVEVEEVEESEECEEENEQEGAEWSEEEGDEESENESE